MPKFIADISCILVGLVMMSTTSAQSTAGSNSQPTTAASASKAASDIVQETVRDKDRSAVYVVQWNKKSNHWHVTATFDAHNNTQNGKGESDGSQIFQENPSSQIEKDNGSAELILLATDPGQNSRPITIIRIRLLFSDRAGNQPDWFHKAGQIAVNWCAINKKRCSGWGGTVPV